MTSITAQVRRSVSSISVLLAVPALIGLVVMLIYSSRTQAMIRRMDAAAQMKPAFSMWRPDGHPLQKAAWRD